MTKTNRKLALYRENKSMIEMITSNDGNESPEYSKTIWRRKLTGNSLYRENNQWENDYPMMKTNHQSI